MKVYRYKKEDEYTYALGATVVMEYLLNNPSLVQGVIFILILQVSKLLST